ncbi:MAG: hypothetical protein ACRET5_19765 [Steroidobacteraceae bacterium]
MQEHVDALLLEQGALASLELLFATGRLLYADYEAWRRGEIGSLDEVLMGRREAVREELEEAAVHARALGLVEQSNELTTPRHTSIGTGALCISDDPRLGALIASRYVPAQSAPQMDLFFDNPVVSLVNGLVNALALADAAEAARQLDRLYAKEPNHPELAAFDRLLEALGHVGRPIADCGEELEFIRSITPCAWRLLGARARHLLVPLWRHLAEALGSKPFSPQAPLLHASHAWSEAHAWEEVRASVLGEPLWCHHLPLALRLIESSLRRRRRAEALWAWFQLCWRMPQRAPDALGALNFPDLHALWQRFLEAEEESPVPAGHGCALSAADFPAWLLLDEPALAERLPAEPPTGASAGEERYRLARRWIAARAARRPAEEMALRRALKESQPALFGQLLRAVEKAL